MTHEVRSLQDDGADRQLTWAVIEVYVELAMTAIMVAAGPDWGNDAVIFADSGGTRTDGIQAGGQLKHIKLNDHCALGFTGISYFHNSILARLFNDADAINDEDIGMRDMVWQIENEGWRRNDLSFQEAQDEISQHIEDFRGWMLDNIGLPDQMYAANSSIYMVGQDGNKLGYVTWNSDANHSAMPTFEGDHGGVHEASIPFSAMEARAQRTSKAIFKNKTLGLEQRIQRGMRPVVDRVDRIESPVYVRRITNRFELEELAVK